MGVLAVIGNTIRLEIQARRAEIEVTKLVGGSNAFVRRPFLYTGVLYGLGGALLAWAILALVLLILREPVASLARLYGSRFELQGLAPEDVAVLLGGGLRARLARRLDLRRAPPAQHRAARLKARRGNLRVLAAAARAAGLQVLAGSAPREARVASIQRRMRRASATRVRLP